jgi:hypothetical protein
MHAESCMHVGILPSMTPLTPSLHALWHTDAPDIDWSILEEVAAHVSRTSLAGMQQLWKTHASTMDVKGKVFASQVYGIHSQVIKDMASMKTFELKPIIHLVNDFTAGVRETMLDVFAQMRESDNEFAQQIYQATRRTFVQNLKQALDARDAWHQEKVRGEGLQTCQGA